MLGREEKVKKKQAARVAANLGSALGSSVVLSGKSYPPSAANRRIPTKVGDVAAEAAVGGSPPRDDSGLQVVRQLAPGGDQRPAVDGSADRDEVDAVFENRVLEQLKAQRYLIEASADDLRIRLNTAIQALQEQQTQLTRIEKSLPARPAHARSVGHQGQGSRSNSKGSGAKRPMRDPSESDAKYVAAVLERQFRQKQAQKLESCTVCVDGIVDDDSERKAVLNEDRGHMGARSKMGSVMYHYKWLGIMLQRLHRHSVGFPVQREPSPHGPPQGDVFQDMEANETARAARSPRPLTIDVVGNHSEKSTRSTPLADRGSPTKTADSYLEQTTDKADDFSPSEEKATKGRRPRALTAMEAIFSTGAVASSCSAGSKATVSSIFSTQALQSGGCGDVTDGQLARARSRDALDQVLQKYSGSTGPISSTHRDWGIRKNSAHIVSCAMLMVYLAFLGYRADHEMRVLRGAAEPADWMPRLEIFFSVALVVEIVANMVMQRMRFFVGSGAGWRWFDAFLLLCTISDLLATAKGSHAFQVTRLFRAVRGARSIRSVSYVRDLRLMVAAIIVSFSSFLWAIFLLAFIIYIFATFILLTLQQLHHQAGTSVECPSPLCNYYGTLIAAMVSLFEAITGGEDWWALLSPLHTTSRMYSMFYIVYITFVLFGLLNVLFAMFVKNTAHVASIDKELVVSEELMKRTNAIKLFSTFLHKMDRDGDGVITSEELELMLGNDDMVVYLREADMETVNAQTGAAAACQSRGCCKSLRRGEQDMADLRFLFSLLDFEETGEVSLQCFVDGMVRLKGHAKAMDTENIMSENKRIQVRLGALSRYIEDRMDLQDHRLMNLSNTLGTSSAETPMSPDSPLPQFFSESCPRKISEYVNDEEVSGRANTVARLNGGARGTRTDLQLGMQTAGGHSSSIGSFFPKSMESLDKVI